MSAAKRVWWPREEGVRLHCTDIMLQSALSVSCSWCGGLGCGLCYQFGGHGIDSHKRLLLSGFLFCDCPLSSRYFDGTLPPYCLSCCLSSYSPHRSLRSSSQKRLTLPRVNPKGAGARSFPHQALFVWNSLPFFFFFLWVPGHAR